MYKLYKKCCARNEVCADKSIIYNKSPLNFLLNFICYPVYIEAINNKEPLIALGSSLGSYFGFKNLINIAESQPPNIAESFGAITTIIQFLKEWQTYEPFRQFCEDRFRLDFYGSNIKKYIKSIGDIALLQAGANAAYTEVTKFFCEKHVDIKEETITYSPLVKNLCAYFGIKI